MVRKTVVALAISAALMGATSARASAQIAAGVYVPAPPVYVEMGPMPGPGYVWMPRYHRWEFHGYNRRFYRDRDWRRDRREYFERHR